MIVIAGLEEAVKLLDRLERLPAQAAAAVAEKPRGVRIGEYTRGKVTLHRVGKKLAAATLPAKGETGWISVLNPKRGTTRGPDRTRYGSHEAALDHSRAYTIEVAEKQADKRLPREFVFARSELDRLLGAL
jgi:hypothetical protein